MVGRGSIAGLVLALSLLGGCRDRAPNAPAQPERIDLLALFPFTTSAPRTEQIDLADPDQRHLLIHGWTEPTLLADESRGAWVIDRTAAFAFDAGPRPVDVEVSIHRRLVLPGTAVSAVGVPRRQMPAPPRLDVNGVPRRREAGSSPTVLRLRLPASILRPGRNRMTIRERVRRNRPGASHADRRGAEPARAFYTHVVLRHLEAPGPAVRVTNGALHLDAGAEVTFYLRAPAEARLSFRTRKGDAPPQVEVHADGEAPRTLPDRDARTDAVDEPLGVEPGAVVGLTLRAMERTRVLEPAITGTTAADLDLAHTPPAERPNVIVYLADTLRADRLGCYGYERPTSPHLDRLARQAVLFEQAMSSASWTRPATATLFTGRDPAGHGALTLRDRLLPGVPTLAELLAAHGWETAAFVTNVNVAGIFGFDRGFDHFEYLPEDTARRGVYAPADDLHARGLAWLDGRAETTPFLLYLHASDPHMPYHPPDEVADAFIDPADAAAVDRRTVFEYLTQPAADVPPAARRVLGALYDADVATLDAAIGRLWDELERRGRDRDTLLVFVGDHGEELGDHGGFEHGHTLYAEQTHVPLLIRLPGGRGGGRRVPHLVRMLDVLPTVLALAGIQSPVDLPGTPLLGPDGAPTSAPRDGFASTWLGRNPLETLVVPPWKVILSAGAGAPAEVYDLERDPHERHDLAADHGVLIGYARQCVAMRALSGPVEEAAPAPAPPLDPQVEERLRALGYVVD